MRKRFPLVVLLLAGAAFVLGLARLYTLRFERGDVYPHYSSLRADPLGTKALFESVNRFVRAQRNYRPLSRLEPEPATTLLVLGAEEGDLVMPRPEFEKLDTFVKNGGRVVFALVPEIEAPRYRAFAGPPPVSPRKTTGGKADDEEHEEVSPVVFLTNEWSLTLAFAALEQDEDKTFRPAIARRREDSPLPPEVAIHSGQWFDYAESNGWRVVYERTNDQPVLIERRFGRGSVVLCADAYPFSNEALLEDREPALLAWVLGPARQVIFDETHLGVQEDPGVATLARRYRLHGVFAVLVVLAGLYVWKNSSSLLPPLEARHRDATGEAVEGRDSATGFVNLLRRSISRDQILKTCIEQWTVDCAHTTRASQPRLEQMQAAIDAENALPPRRRDPVGTYRRFVAILSKRGMKQGVHDVAAKPQGLPRKETIA